MSVVCSASPITVACQSHEQKYLFPKMNKLSKKVSDFVKGVTLFVYDSQRASKKKETSYSSHELFWNTTVPDINYKMKDAVKDHFEKFEQLIEVEKDGQKLQMKCLVFQSKGANDSDCQNHLIVQGNTSTLDNNFPGIYPFLEGHLQQENPPKARFVVFNHYDHKKDDKTFLPSNMDEWGLMFKKGVEGLTGKFGKFQTMCAHSLGNMPMIAQFKHYKTEDFEKYFPQTLLLAKGPCSIYETSKNLPFSWGIYPWGWFFIVAPIMYFFAKLTGWTLELDETLVNYLKKVDDLKKENKSLEEILKKTKIVITEVKKDYYFPGKASLCQSKKLDELHQTEISLHRLTFDIEPQLASKDFNHNYPPHGFQRQAMVREKITKGANTLADHQGQKTIVDIQAAAIEGYKGLQCGVHLPQWVVTSKAS